MPVRVHSLWCVDREGRRSARTGDGRVVALVGIHSLIVFSVLGAGKPLRLSIFFARWSLCQAAVVRGFAVVEQIIAGAGLCLPSGVRGFVGRVGFMIAPVYTNSFSALTSTAHFGNRVGRYFDPVSGCHFVIARPAAQPELWSAYLGGARISYRRFGVERVLEYDKTRDGRSTALFFAAIDRDGQVAGGMRAQGPYPHADRAHAVVEWAGHDGAAALHAEISERIPAGVIEMKTGWVSHHAARRMEVTAALARVFVHSMTLLNVRYALGTVAAHAVARWQTTGGVVSATVPPVAYPDDRYLTSAMWWDRESYADLATAEQLPRLIDESAQFGGADHPGLSAPAA
ncbi:hypothetical protein ACVBEQ_23265 [Nakamurella sp. GG22]